MDEKYVQPKLEYNTVYHIYNCGINGCNIFNDDNDYLKFLSKYVTYIEPVADTFAWSLLRNHFHIIIRIKKENEIKTLIETKSLETRTEVRTPDKKPNPAKQFSHLFNAYAQYFNHKYNRHGALFESPFKRNIIDNRAYLKRCLIYVHQNPVFHGFVERLEDYRYTSYNAVLSEKFTRIKRKTVLNLFENIDGFNSEHENLISLEGSFDE